MRTAKIVLLFNIVFVLLWVAMCSAVESLEGVIEPHVKVEFRSQSPGILQEVLVNRGDYIKKGQVIARLKFGVEEAVVEQSRTLLEFAKRKDQRNHELSTKDLISRQEKDEIETEMKKLEKQLREAEERLKLRTIVSTIDGIVTERNLYAGEYAGENTPILKAATIDPLNVEVIVPLKLFGSIKKGMKAEVHPEEPVGGTYLGEVVIVDKVMDAASGTFGVRVELANKDYKLPAGLKGKVQFPGN
jgi:membrane fusion protein, multidrug efflux system